MAQAAKKKTTAAKTSTGTSTKRVKKDSVNSAERSGRKGTADKKKTEKKKTQKSSVYDDKYVLTEQDQSRISQFGKSGWNDS